MRNGNGSVGWQPFADAFAGIGMGRPNGMGAAPAPAPMPSSATIQPFQPTPSGGPIIACPPGSVSMGSQCVAVPDPDYPDGTWNCPGDGSVCVPSDYRSGMGLTFKRLKAIVSQAATKWGVSIPQQTFDGANVDPSLVQALKNLFAHPNAQQAAPLEAAFVLRGVRGATDVAGRALWLLTAAGAVLNYRPPTSASTNIPGPGGGPSQGLCPDGSVPDANGNCAPAPPTQPPPVPTNSGGGQLPAGCQPYSNAVWCTPSPGQAPISVGPYPVPAGCTVVGPPSPGLLCQQGVPMPPDGQAPAATTPKRYWPWILGGLAVLAVGGGAVYFLTRGD